jgi:hypothetical protein
MNTVAASADPTAWGTLGILDENTLAYILRQAGHSTIRCINKNGRTLANSTMNAERDDRAKTVQHSNDDWEAWTIIHRIVQGYPMDNIEYDTFEDHEYRDSIEHIIRDSIKYGICATKPTHMIVKANSDILIAMARAAFGQLVLGCIDTIECGKDDGGEYFRTLVFRNVIFWIGTYNGKIQIRVCYMLEELEDMFNIGTIIKSAHQRIGGNNTEGLAVATILQIISIYLEYKENPIDQYGLQTFYTSLANVLPTTSMPALEYTMDALDLTMLRRGRICGKLFDAYHQSKSTISNYFSINDNPDWATMFTAILWNGGPLYHVVENGKYAFRIIQ